MLFINRFYTQSVMWYGFERPWNVIPSKISFFKLVFVEYYYKHYFKWPTFWNLKSLIWIFCCIKIASNVSVYQVSSKYLEGFGIIIFFKEIQNGGLQLKKAGMKNFKLDFRLIVSPRIRFCLAIYVFLWNPV